MPQGVWILFCELGRDKMLIFYSGLSLACQRHSGEEQVMGQLSRSACEYSTSLAGL